MVREIVCSDPYIDSTVATNMGVKSMPLEDLLASSDLISVHLPLTTETEGLLGPEALNGVKRGAFLVNTSRGAVIDEVALAWALESGRLAGAGLDVFVEEPLPPNSPLRRLDNVVFTPHFASNSEEAKQDMFDTVLEIVKDAISGRLPPGLVNPSVTPRHPFTS
jgi:phosphoglycerate dehydrogenase-like enzyme